MARLSTRFGKSTGGSANILAARWLTRRSEKLHAQIRLPLGTGKFSTRQSCVGSSGQAAYEGRHLSTPIRQFGLSDGVHRDVAVQGTTP